MQRREFITLIGGAAAWPLAARAQQAGHVRRIGVLMPESEGTPESQARVAAFHARLQELGWTPGRNLQIDYRWAMGDIERTRTAAADLVNSAPDALLAVATPSLVAIQKATRTIPIVFVAISEPVANGFVASLAHPGGNATGFTNLEPGFGAKWLGLLKEIAPRVARVALMFNPTTAVIELFFRSAEAVSSQFAVEMVKSQVRLVEDIEAAMMSLAGDGSAGLIFPPDTFTVQHSKPIIDLTNRYRLPAVYPFPVFCRRRRARVLWNRRPRPVSAGGRLHRSCLQGRASGRPSGAAADQIPACRQPQDHQSARPRRADDAYRARRRGDRMTMLFAAVHESKIGRYCCKSRRHPPSAQLSNPTGVPLESILRH